MGRKSLAALAMENGSNADPLTTLEQQQPDSISSSNFLNLQGESEPKMTASLDMMRLMSTKRRSNRFIKWLGLLTFLAFIFFSTVPYFVNLYRENLKVEKEKNPELLASSDKDIKTFSRHLDILFYTCIGFAAVSGTSLLLLLFGGPVLQKE